MTPVRGTVINIHYHGATVRLEDGTLAAISASELAANRPTYVASAERREPLGLLLDRAGRHHSVMLTRPVERAAEDVSHLVDVAFERQIGAYLKATEEWAPADRPAPAERHFIRKKRRSALFEARNKPT